MTRGHQPIVLARRAGRAAEVPCPAIDGDVRDDRVMREAEAHVRALEVGETGDEYIHRRRERVADARVRTAARGTPLP